MNLDDLRTSRAAVVTVAEAASLLGVDIRTVSRAIQSGELPVLHLGRRLLIPRLRLLEMLGVDEDENPEDDTPPPRAGLRSVREQR